MRFLISALLVFSTSTYALVPGEGVPLQRETISVANIMVCTADQIHEILAQRELKLTDVIIGSGVVKRIGPPTPGYEVTFAISKMGAEKTKLGDLIVERTDSGEPDVSHIYNCVAKMAWVTQN